MPRPPKLTLGYRVALLIAVLLVSSAVITMLFSLRSVQSTMAGQSRESVDNIHASVSALVSLEYENIVTYREEAIQRRKAELADVASPLVAALDGLRASAGRGEVTVDQARASALAYLTSVRFANSDYFFTFDRDMTAIAHPDAALQGRNLIALRDADGQEFVRELREVALGEGSGYVDYLWNRLGEEEPSAKLAYVFHYEPWDWIIGTGVYVDDIDAEVAQRMDVVRTLLARTLGDIQFSGTGFSFILDSEGQVVAAPADRDLNAIGSTAGGRRIIDQVNAAAPAVDGEIASLDVDAALGEDGTQPWVLNISSFEALGWHLVTAVPRDEIDAPGLTLALQQAAVSLIVLLVGLASGLLLSRRLIRPVEQVTGAARDLSRDSFDPTTLDRAAQRTDEIGELARTFQRMGVEIIARERRLREQVAKLKVEIDRTKVDRAVDEITETDYFQRLKERAQELRRERAAEPEE